MSVIRKVIVVTTVNSEVTAQDFGLLQRACRSKDAQNEQEKGHGNDGAHFAQVREGATTAL